MEKRYVVYLLSTTVAFVFLFYFAVAPDVMQHQGRGWENVAAKMETNRALAAARAAKAGEGAHGHGQTDEQGGEAAH